MARKRMIDPSIWNSQYFQAAPCDSARLLWFWLINNADDDGRLTGNLAYIRAGAFTYNPDIELSDIEAWLNLAQKLHCIVRYQVEGFYYVALLNFRKYQYIQKPIPSNLPAPPEDVTLSSEYDTTIIPLSPNRMEKNLNRKEEKAGKPATRLSPPLPDYASLKDKIPEGRIRLLWADYEAMCAGRRASNTIAESVLCAMLSKLLDKIATDGITPEAACYGLEAAIVKQADNINYVLNAARGYNPPGKMPDKPPPKATQLFKPKPGVEVSEAI